MQVSLLYDITAPTPTMNKKHFNSVLTKGGDGDICHTFQKMLPIILFHGVIAPCKYTVPFFLYLTSKQLYNEWAM